MTLFCEFGTEEEARKVQQHAAEILQVEIHQVAILKSPLRDMWLVPLVSKALADEIGVRGVDRAPGEYAIMTAEHHDPELDRQVILGETQPSDEYEQVRPGIWAKRGVVDVVRRATSRLVRRGRKWHRP